MAEASITGEGQTVTVTETEEAEVNMTDQFNHRQTIGSSKACCYCNGSPPQRKRMVDIKCQHWTHCSGSLHNQEMA